MFDNIITDEQLDMLLRQQDAENIKSKTGHIGKAEFPISEDVNIMYQYCVTDDGIMFLQRMRPTRRSFGRITDASEAVKISTYEVHNYKRGADAGRFDDYIRLSDSLSQLHLSLEELFLMYHPDDADLEGLYEKMDELHQYMNRICRK